ncbi:hypothetical protein CgunFtcFv8_020570 [Champsocephalus gunnari]|uniref:Uncharacterized protein n=1 Tax=Champsocephalus gunnari TaxID=52237 RepID=A0AAN8E5U2_CHAGU|nr:hypothetical protein CgunFtcFv8_020570 [Champsocephalus gunnari]
MSKSLPPLAVKARIHPSVENRESALLLSRRKLGRLARPQGRSRAGERRREAAGCWSREVELPLRRGPDRQTDQPEGGGG